ncbi:MAG: hypothetical protein ABIU18_08845, partial [Novosphingobium sp.]
MWFAMNNRIPQNRSPIRSATPKEIDRTGAKVVVNISIGIGARPDGSVDTGVSIFGKFNFRGHCVPRKPIFESDGATKSQCLMPDLVVRAANFTAEKTKDQKLEISFPQREIAVRFDVAPRLMGARLMSGVYFE